MNKYIQKLISEQFSINDLDFNNDSDYQVDIFNSAFNISSIICDKILNCEEVDKSDIECLNQLVSDYVPKNKDELRKIIEYYSDNHPYDSLNWLNVSVITDMSDMFRGEYVKPFKYNGDISKWDVSNVVNMSKMFYLSEFNSDISKWDVSNVADMSYMFYWSKFNDDISQWDVSKVNDMTGIFWCSEFNQNI